MNDCVISIAPNGETLLRFVVNAEILGIPQAGRVFSRSRNSPLLNDQLRMLRFGDASDDVVNEVRAKLSEWFLGSDLDSLLLTALDLSGMRNEPIRLVVSINDLDLRDRLADLPFELMGLSGSTDPLILSPRIASIVHLLDKVGTPTTKISNWPLKILIVRSNPKDLGGAIPAADPIRQSLLKMMVEDPELDPRLIKIDILSSEDAAQLAGPPTIEGLEIQLPKAEYDILIYLGHGDISSDVSPGKKIGGVLQLENETGELHRVLEAGKLAKLLSEPNQVPVVLLLGCLTASEDIPESLRAGVRELLPQWLRGSLGVAQVLINSESGVQFVVGMRYKIDTSDAVDFINFFFRSLLRTRPGNVEAAVRSARNKLSGKSYMWSAPVIFSTLGDEPLFPFIEDPPDCPTVEGSEKFRKRLWKDLSKVKWAARDHDVFKELVSDWHDGLSECEQEMITEMQQHKATLMIPGFSEFKAGAEIRVPVRLIGRLNQVEEIEGKITISGGTLPITNLEASQHLSDSGFELSSLNNNTGFLIRPSEAAGPLEQGNLFDIVGTVPPETQGVLVVSISKIRTRPMMKVCPVDNAIVLPMP